MNDAPKKKMGRPLGSKNKPKEESGSAISKPQYKMKAKPNWDDVDDFVEETPDRLRIDPELVPEGMSLQWVTETVYGQPVPQRRAAFEKRGWTPVHQSDFDGVFDGMFMPRGAEGEIKMDGVVLMVRPAELTRKAKAMDRRNAEEKIRIKEAALRGGDLGTTLDSRDPSALGFNKIGKTMERIEIPE